MFIEKTHYISLWISMFNWSVKLPEGSRGYIPTIAIIHLIFWTIWDLPSMSVAVPQGELTFGFAKGSRSDKHVFEEAQKGWYDGVHWGICWFQDFALLEFYHLYLEIGYGKPWPAINRQTHLIRTCSTGSMTCPKLNLQSLIQSFIMMFFWTRVVAIVEYLLGCVFVGLTPRIGSLVLWRREMFLTYTRVLDIYTGKQTWLAGKCTIDQWF